MTKNEKMQEVGADDVTGLLEIVQHLQREYCTAENRYVPRDHVAFRQALDLVAAIRETARMYVLDDLDRPLGPVADAVTAVLAAAVHERLQALGVSGRWTFAGEDSGVRVTVSV